MSTVYERAQYEIRRVQYERCLLDKRLEELEKFVRLHEELAAADARDSSNSPLAVVESEPSAEPADSVPPSVESKPEDADGPREKPDPAPTQTEEMASFAIHEFGPMRARNLFDIIVGYGYEPVGKNPIEVLRMRLLRSQLFQSEDGVFSLRSGA